jgi:hypothetical protein
MLGRMFGRLFPFEGLGRMMQLGVEKASCALIWLNFAPKPGEPSFSEHRASAP